MSVAVACVIACAVTPLTGLADAQTDGPEKFENHELVYAVHPPYSVTDTVLVIDQFGAYRPDSLTMDRYGVPVLKNGEGVVDPLRFHTWWLMHPPNPEPIRSVLLDNQFGTQELTVGDGRYLLLPALKNDTNNDPPRANHYECYDADGPPVDVLVSLNDQFGGHEAFVTRPLFFCNPAEKRHGDEIYQIEYEAYLTCYELEPPPTLFEWILALDQFGTWDIELMTAEWLCVPTEKFDVVPSRDASWGTIKARYR